MERSLFFTQSKASPKKRTALFFLKRVLFVVNRTVEYGDRITLLHIL